MIKTSNQATPHCGGASSTLWPFKSHKLLKKLYLVDPDVTHTQLIEFANSQYIVELINTHKPAIHIIIKINYHYGTRDYHKGKIVSVTYNPTKSEITIR